MEAHLPAERVVDLILVLVVLEAVLIALYHRATGRGVAPRDLVLTLLSGGCLLLALRLALSGAELVWVALALTGALLAHLADLYRRWN